MNDITEDRFWDISMVVAFSKDTLVIGDKGKIPWGKCAEDLKRFKLITTGKLYGGDPCVIMGRKTYESIGKPLPDRINVVMSRNEEFKKRNNKPEGDIVVCSDLDEIFDFLRSRDIYAPFVIGGSEMYSLFFPYCNRIFVTEFAKQYEGDTKFPMPQPHLDERSEWELFDEDTINDGEKPFRFYIWEMNT